MISSEKFIEQCLEFGFNFFTGTPCSYLKPFINYTLGHPQIQFIDSVNEGDAVAMASGAYMAGKRPVVMFQNSGLGNAVNALTSLCAICRVPMLVIVTLRGEPGGPADEPQHELMGKITIPMIETMGFDWSYFPQEESAILPTLQKVLSNFGERQSPYFLVMRKGDVDECALAKKTHTPPVRPEIRVQDDFKAPSGERLTRTQALQKLRSQADAMAVVATTGMTGRELYELGDTANQFYMVGSMGCALSIGFGIALQKRDKKVLVIDGDGALLMRTGPMATVGHYRPENLIHVLLDNEVHDSTGAQSTVSGPICFKAIALAFGYQTAESTDQGAGFSELYQRAQVTPGPHFIHLKIQAGHPKNVGRPKSTPAEVTARFIQYLK